MGRSFGSIGSSGRRLGAGRRVAAAALTHLRRRRAGRYAPSWPADATTVTKRHRRHSACDSRPWGLGLPPPLVARRMPTTRRTAVTCTRTSSSAGLVTDSSMTAAIVRLRHRGAAGAGSVRLPGRTTRDDNCQLDRPGAVHGQSGSTCVTTSVMDAAGAAWSASDTVGAPPTTPPRWDRSRTSRRSPERDLQLLRHGSAPGTHWHLTLSGGAGPPATEGPLDVGSYSFNASYSGDANYAHATGGCEPLSVGKAVSTVTTAVKDAANGATWPRPPRPPGPRRTTPPRSEPSRTPRRSPEPSPTASSTTGPAPVTGDHRRDTVTTQSAARCRSRPPRARWPREATPSWPATPATSTTPAATGQL